MALSVLYVLFRVGSFTNIGDRVTDTPSYEHVAHLVLWSSGFWTGQRGFTIPLFYKVFQSTESRIVAQLVFSIIAWLVLAGVVASCVRAARIAPIAFAIVLAFSVTTDVVLWDTLLISESITFALGALLIASWLKLVRSPCWPWVATILGLSVLWVFARDTNAYVVLAVGISVALSIIRPEYRHLKVALAIGSCAVFLLDYGSAQAGKRWLQPLTDVVAHRVVPDSSMRAYFVARGLDLNTNWPVSSWMRSRSEGVYADYLLSHPGYTLFQPFYGHQQALYSSSSNAESLLDPNLSTYDDNAGHRFLPLPASLDRIIFPRGIALLLTLLGIVVAAAIATWRWLGRTSSWLVPLGILATTYPHYLVVWLQSGVEVDRHAFEAAMLLRLAGLILAVFVVDRLVTTGARRAQTAATTNSLA